MKILFTIKEIHNARGGAERVLANISASLQERGHDISLLTSDLPNGSRPFYELHPNIKKLFIGIGQSQRKTTLWEFLMRVKEIRKTVLEDRPEVVISFMHSMFVPTSFALIGTGIPIIASEHIVMGHYKKRRFEFLLFMISIFFVKRITVLSERIKKEYPRYMHRKMVVISNPVLSATKQAQPSNENGQRKKILNIGRLDPQKGQEILIRAFAHVASKYPDWDIDIFGDGFLRQDLENLIFQLGMDKRIFMKGTTHNIFEEYQKAHIFALPSYYESFGLVTAEAMAHGLPVIGFADCPGTNELIVDQENGILVDVEKKDRILAFAESLETMIVNPDMRSTLGKAALKRANFFHIDEITQQWEDLLKTVI